MKPQKNRSGVSRVFWLSLIAAVVLTLITFCRASGNLSVEEVRQHRWVPDLCPLTACQAADVSFDSADCQLRDDGILYQHNKPIARFVEAHYPMFPEAAPRTGGKLVFEDIVTGQICRFDSTDR